MFPIRILVMYEGEIVGQLNPNTVSVEELGLYMAGAKKRQDTCGSKLEGGVIKWEQKIRRAIYRRAYCRW